MKRSNAMDLAVLIMQMHKGKYAHCQFSCECELQLLIL